MSRRGGLRGVFRMVTLGVVVGAMSWPVHAASCEAVLDDVLTTFRKAERVPALAVAVVRPEDACVQAAGAADPGTGIPASTRTRFAVASISKLFTTVAAMQLVESQRLGLADPLERYLPEFSGRGIRIEHLLTHTSGLRDVRRPAGRDEPEAVAEYLRAIARARRAFPPGEGWRYTDAAFNVLGAVIARVAGVPFPEHVRQRLLEPLGMTRSTFDPRTLPPGSIAAPFRRGWFGLRPARSEWDLAFAPSSGLHASIEDLARFARFAVNRGEIDGVRLLSTGTFEAMWRPRHATRWPGIEIGLGWQVVEHAGERVVQHAGSAAGYQSLLTLYPDRGAAIVSAGNVAEWPRFVLHDALAERLW